MGMGSGYAEGVVGCYSGGFAGGLLGSAVARGGVHPNAPVGGAAEPASVEHRQKLELRMKAVAWADLASRKH